MSETPKVCQICESDLFEGVCRSRVSLGVSACFESGYHMLRSRLDAVSEDQAKTATRLFASELAREELDKALTQLIYASETIALAIDTPTPVGPTHSDAQDLWAVIRSAEKALLTKGMK